MGVMNCSSLQKEIHMFIKCFLEENDTAIGMGGEEDGAMESL